MDLSTKQSRPPTSVLICFPFIGVAISPNAKLRNPVVRPSKAVDSLPNSPVRYR